MKKELYSLYLVAVALTALASCDKEDVIDVDSGFDLDSGFNTDSCLIWHVGDAEHLDSLVEYGKNGLIAKTVWTYDEYGRILVIDEYSANGLPTSKSLWDYSEGGKKISVTKLSNTNGVWMESGKSEKTVVATNDTITTFYRKEGGLWLPTGHNECIYDENGRLVMICGFVTGMEIGDKTVYVYDGEGRCVQEKRYVGHDEDWELVSQMDCSFDDKGNCIFRKRQRMNYNTGSFIGDSLMERSFDDKNREVYYSLLRWDYSEDTWVGKQKYSLAYDERGNVIENVIFAWDTANKDWLPKDKTTKSYDEQGRLTSDANYFWKDNKWVGMGPKYEKSYDSNGNLIFDANYVWNNNENDWVLNNYTTNEFDSDGNKTHYLSRNGSTIQEYSLKEGYIITEIGTYNSFTGEASNETRRLEYFDENGNDTLIVEYHWLQGQWKESERLRYTYDDRGNPNSSSKYQNQNGEWVMTNGFKYEINREGNTETRQKYTWNLFYKRWDENSIREVLTYDESDRIMILLTQGKVWENGVDTHWEDEDKTEYTYDSYGNIIEFVESDWYQNENRWKYRHKQEFAFDADGNQTLETDYMFDAAHGVWNGGFKWTAEYDEQGNQTLLMSYDWGYQKGWKPVVKTVSIFDENGNLLDRSKYEMTYRNGAWDWQGTKRTIYTFDPDTQAHLEYNLTFNYITQSWEGSRRETETDGQGKVVSEILYKWIDEEWYKSAEKRYDSKGNIIFDGAYGKADGQESSMIIAYTYDSNNRLVETVRTYNGEVVYSKTVYYSIHKDIKVIDAIKK